MKTVAAAIALRAGRVLLARRRQGESNQGCWEFPGGAVRKGETPQQALEREIFEELGVKATAGPVFARNEHRYPGGAIMLVAVRAELESADFKLTDHDLTEWVPLEKLLEYDLSPADIPIARKLTTPA
ncbi:MAG: (deoxy)nucleoside triphosphate pyrophosphohydrolase [Candidatus Edwardsbacteria bacterium]|nr:(deoxy)nucleoside triphosphate pyrophosphohydrolase [Candidatus Edwardsbacteria bacterium]